MSVGAAVGGGFEIMAAARLYSSASSLAGFARSTSAYAGIAQNFASTAVRSYDVGINAVASSRRISSIGSTVANTGHTTDVAAFIRNQRAVPRGTHIGTVNRPGLAGGPINPGELTDNCVACVGANLHNKIIRSGSR